jgi:hypothetical protein
MKRKNTSELLQELKEIQKDQDALNEVSKCLNKYDANIQSILEKIDRDEETDVSILDYYFRIKDLIDKNFKDANLIYNKKRSQNTNNSWNG